MKEELDEALRNLTHVLHEELLEGKQIAVDHWNEKIAPALSKVRGSFEKLSKKIKEL